MNTRPACSDFFHRLKWLIKSKPDHGTDVSGSVRRAVNADFTTCRH
ncbi:hypothetical protein [Nocardia sp. NPDC005998]